MDSNHYTKEDKLSLVAHIAFMVACMYAMYAILTVQVHQSAIEALIIK